MKILITNYHLSGGGGHTTYIKSLVDSGSSSHSYVVACPSSSNLFSKISGLKVKVYDIAFPGKLKELINVYRQARRLRKLIVTECFDAVHVNGSPDHRLLMLVLLTLPRVKSPKIIFTKHNSLDLSDSFWTCWRFEKFCDVIILVCSGLHTLIPDRIKKHATLTVIENGVDTQRFAPNSRDRKYTLRQQNKIAATTLVFASCAGSARHKGWHYLARAAANNPNFLILMIGDRPSDQALVELIGDIGISNLRFTGHQEDVRPFLALADVGFVLSTSIETASFACREMMAMGLPVLVSDVGCLPETIDPASGWVVPAGNQESIEDALDVIMKADLESMSKASRDRAERNFSINTFRLETERCYQTVIKEDRV